MISPFGVLIYHTSYNKKCINFNKLKLDQLLGIQIWRHANVWGHHH